MKNIWSKHKSLILVLGYAAVFVVVAVMLTNYLVSGIVSDADRIQTQALDREVEKTRADQLPQMEENWKNFQSKENSLDVILNPANQIAFIENIEAIASKTGNIADLKIEENTAAPVAEKNKKPASKDKDQPKSLMDQISIKDSLLVQINLEGNFEGLVNFIHMLENSPIYVNIVSIKTKKELVEVDNQSALNESSDVFNPNPLPSSNPNPTENIPEKKEVLKSTVSAVVYTKK